MAEVRITFDDGTEQTHVVPDMGAREMDGTLRLWHQYSGGITIDMADGGEEVVLPPRGLRDYEDEEASQSGLHEPNAMTAEQAHRAYERSERR